MHNHVIDDDIVVRRTQKCGKLLIETADEVATFEVGKITEFHIRLRCQIGLSERKGVNRGTPNIADEKNVIRAKCERTGGLG